MGRSGAFLRMLLEAGIITALKCLCAPGRATQRGEDDAGERFFDRGVRDSGKKMEEGDGI